MTNSTSRRGTCYGRRSLCFIYLQSPIICCCCCCCGCTWDSLSYQFRHLLPVEIYRQPMIGSWCIAISPHNVPGDPIFVRGWTVICGTPEQLTWRLDPDNRFHCYCLPLPTLPSNASIRCHPLHHRQETAGCCCYCYCRHCRILLLSARERTDGQQFWGRTTRYRAPRSEKSAWQQA